MPRPRPGRPARRGTVVYRNDWFTLSRRAKNEMRWAGFRCPTSPMPEAGMNLPLATRLPAPLPAPRGVDAIRPLAHNPRIGKSGRLGKSGQLGKSGTRTLAALPLWSRP
jgi:hypothetical protein